MMLYYDAKLKSRSIGSAFLHEAFSFGEVVEQGGVKGFFGVEQDIVNESVATFLPKACNELFHVFLVGGGNVPRFGGNLGARFQINKAGFSVELEVTFSWVEDVKNNHFMLAVSKVFEAR